MHSLKQAGMTAPSPHFRPANIQMAVRIAKRHAEKGITPHEMRQKAFVMRKRTLTLAAAAEFRGHDCPKQEELSTEASQLWFDAYLLDLGASINTSSFMSLLESNPSPTRLRLTAEGMMLSAGNFMVAAFHANDTGKDGTFLRAWTPIALNQVSQASRLTAQAQLLWERADHLEGRFEQAPAAFSP